MTRAQEAEENYVIKRELAVVRQQCSTASESLEKAQDTIRELQQQKVKRRTQLFTCEPFISSAKIQRGDFTFAASGEDSEVPLQPTHSSFHDLCRQNHSLYLDAEDFFFFFFKQRRQKQ